MRYGATIDWKGQEDAQHWAKTHVHLVRFKFDNGQDHNQKPYDVNNPADFSNYRKPRQHWNNKRGK